MYLALFEHSFVLGAILEVDHTLAMLSIIFPFSDIHVTIRILSESLTTEAPIYEVSLISYASIFNKHSKAIMFAIQPLSFVVLALILPHIDSISIEVVFNELSFIAMAALLEYKNTETMHNIWSSLFY
jgi:hypothetical protein